ncbi:M15 family metallopeptidase [Alkalibacter sp. M17DMB]|nr:M15 family metallopeptidase [Alkalibacter mobilis]
MIIISLLITVSCSTRNSETDNTNKTPYPIIEKIGFSSDTEVKKGNYVAPGETFTIRALIVLKEKDGSISTVEDDDISIEIINSADYLSLKENIITVKEDVTSGVIISLKATYESHSETLSYFIKKNPDNHIDSDGIVTDYEQTDCLVNKERSLPQDYVPDDLVHIEVPSVLTNLEVNQLRKSASDALTDLFEEARTAGYTLKARSGYRSYSTQKSLFNNSVARNGLEHAKKYSAPPGHSEHQTGLAMDITSESVNNQLYDSFGATPEGIWVAENAHLFGFIIRYPEGKEDITGYEYEPWHLRYLGIELATDIYKTGLTMEEYFRENPSIQ